jgi:hypothetical protein
MLGSLILKKMYLWYHNEDSSDIYRYFTRFPLSLVSSVKSITPFLLLITKVSSLPWLRINVFLTPQSWQSLSYLRNSPQSEKNPLSVTLRNVLVLYSELSVPNTTWRMTPCRLSAIIYLIQYIPCYPPHLKAVSSIHNHMIRSSNRTSNFSKISLRAQKVYMIWNINLIKICRSNSFQTFLCAVHLTKPKVNNLHLHAV